MTPRSELSQGAIEERIVCMAIEAMREKWGRPPATKPVLKVIPKAPTREEIP